MKKLSHADVIDIVHDEYRLSPEPAIGARTIVDTFETARGLIRRVCIGERLDREAMSLLIRRKTPPLYVGDTVVLAFMADVLDLKADLEDALKRIGELKQEGLAKDTLIAEQKKMIGELRSSLELRVARARSA